MLPVLQTKIFVLSVAESSKSARTRWQGVYVGCEASMVMSAGSVHCGAQRRDDGGAASFVRLNRWDRSMRVWKATSPSEMVYFVSFANPSS